LLFFSKILLICVVTLFDVVLTCVAKLLDVVLLYRITLLEVVSVYDIKLLEVLVIISSMGYIPNEPTYSQLCIFIEFISINIIDNNKILNE
jgi:hypothetical protein